MKTRYITPLLLALPLLGATAQTSNKSSLQRAVTIEKEFTPIVQDASKINVMPEMEVSASERPDIKYTEWKSARDEAPTLDTLAAGKGGVEAPDHQGEVYAATTREEGDWFVLIEMYLGLSLLFSVVILLMLRTPLQEKKPPVRYRALENQLPTLKIMAVIFPLFNLFTYLFIRRSMHRLRNAERKCENCGHPMHKLNEEEDNQFLTAKENAEEIVRSVDYDVWLCNHCGATEVYAFPNKESHYAECPRCHAHTYALESDRIITPATPFQSGLGEKRYRCRHCHFENVVPYTLPIIITPIIGGGGRGGGFGGGHFGGGFGGGLSGGGGSTSSW